jgi:hypothetical protein
VETTRGGFAGKDLRRGLSRKKFPPENANAPDPAGRQDRGRVVFIFDQSHALKKSFRVVTDQISQTPLALFPER